MTDMSSPSDPISQEKAHRQAVSLGEKQVLPLTARSLTEEEVAAIDHRFYLIILGIFWAGALPLLIGIHAYGDAADPNLTLIVTACALLPTVSLWLFARRKVRQRRDYRDPQIPIEAGEDGIAYRSTSNTNNISYADTKDVTLILQTMGGQKGAGPAVLFLGIFLGTPSGPIQLENRYYKLGTQTTAVIVAKRKQAGLLDLH
jgi:hypothetical protein